MLLLSHLNLKKLGEKLTEIGVQGLMVSEIKGYGRQAGHTEMYRGAEYVVNYIPKIRLELVVPDNNVSKATDIISESAKTGKIETAKFLS